MPTTVTKTIKASGGDYTSLTAWEAGEQGDLVSLDRVAQAEVYAQNYAETLTLSGWTTDASHYIRIYVAAGEGHAGYWDSAKVRVSPGDGFGIVLDNTLRHVRIEGFQFDHVTTSANATVEVAVTGDGTDDIRIFRCLFKGTISGGGGTAAAIHGNANAVISTFKAIDCVFWNYYNVNFASSTLVPGACYNQFCDARFYNCTTFNCRYGWNNAGGASFPMTAINCLAMNAGTTLGIASSFIDFNGTFTSSDYDLSSDGTAPGAHSLGGRSQTSCAFQSITETNSGYLAIGATSAAAGVGTNDPLSGLYAVDVAGNAFVSPWDIGARARPAAAASGGGPLLRGGLTKGALIRGGRLAA